jgi:hypothetical protein
VPHCCATKLAVCLPWFGGLNGEEVFNFGEEVFKFWEKSLVVHDGSLGEVSGRFSQGTVTPEGARRKDAVKKNYV